MATKDQVNLFILSLHKKLFLFNLHAESNDTSTLGLDLNFECVPDIAWYEGVKEYRAQLPLFSGYSHVSDWPVRMHPGSQLAVILQAVSGLMNCDCGLYSRTNNWHQLACRLPNM